ncbi:MAG: 2-dehydropantoate 2-reductase [Candidatus Rokubacteria bacterium]|nr:2-dehydropantoate 2-reductase [Candidatus Rokubacteria bacterium]
MRVAVVGAGGMGGYFGGLLARAGEDVTFVARARTLDALRTRGIAVRSRVAGDFELRVQATDDPRDVGPVDLVLFCVKAYDVDAAAPTLPPLVGADTAVLAVQNGVDHVDRLGRVVGPEHVLGGVSYVYATAEAPGVVVHGGGTRLLVGELAGGPSLRAERLAAMFQQAGIAAELHHDIRVALWEKFTVVCAASGMTALTRLPVGPIMACPESAALVRGLMEEAVAVARAMGVALAADRVPRLFDVLAVFEPSARASQHYDLVDGRRLELESLNGTAVRLGREHSVSTPLNFAVYTALRPYRDGPPALPRGVAAASPLTRTRGLPYKGVALL